MNTSTVLLYYLELGTITITHIYNQCTENKHIKSSISRRSVVFSHSRSPMQLSASRVSLLPAPEPQMTLRHWSFSVWCGYVARFFCGCVVRYWSSNWSESRSGCHWVTTLGKLFTHIVPLVTKQNNLVQPNHWEGNGSMWERCQPTAHITGCVCSSLPAQGHGNGDEHPEVTELWESDVDWGWLYLFSL